MNSAKRSPAADLIRIFAFFSVVSVHFFLHSGFYTQPVIGKRMFVMTLMRSFFIICVPLFLMLSGYLLRKKQPEKSYYKRIGKIIITYLLASLLCVCYCVVFLKQDFSIKNTIFSILNYTAAPYSWYIEMYLGLFLLIPFLNILYNALPSQKCKIGLVLTFVVITALPSVLNIYDFESFPGTSSSAFSKIVPAWWESLYPITYYYIGCYLSEYRLNIKKSMNILLIVFWTVFSGAFCYWRSYKAAFVLGAWCDYPSLFVVILTLLVFTLIININYDKFPKLLARFAQKISGLCLGGFLVSWIFDHKFYPMLSEKVPSMTNRLTYFIIIVPVVCIFSLLTSYLLRKIQCLIEKLFALIHNLVRKLATKTHQAP